jgi:hypothetical protein
MLFESRNVTEDLIDPDIANGDSSQNDSELGSLHERHALESLKLSLATGGMESWTTRDNHTWVNGRRSSFMESLSSCALEASR